MVCSLDRRDPCSCRLQVISCTGQLRQLQLQLDAHGRCCPQLILCCKQHHVAEGAHQLDVGNHLSLFHSLLRGGTSPMWPHMLLIWGWGHTIEQPLSTAGVCLYFRESAVLPCTAEHQMYDCSELQTLQLRCDWSSSQLRHRVVLVIPAWLCMCLCYTAVQLCTQACCLSSTRCCLSLTERCVASHWLVLHHQ